jgi:hypothetical protein
MTTLSEVLTTLTTLRDNLDQEERITRRLGFMARGPLGQTADRFRKRKELVQQAIDQLNGLQAQVTSLEQQLAACQAQLP